MKISFKDRCGYKKGNRERPYYLVIANIFVYSMLAFILSNRLLPGYVQTFEIFMSVSGLALVAYCLEEARREYVCAKVLNLTSCLYALFYIAALILLPRLVG